MEGRDGRGRRMRMRHELILGWAVRAMAVGGTSYGWVTGVLIQKWGRCEPY